MYLHDQMKHGKLNILLLILSMGILVSSCDKKDVDIDLTARDWKVEKIKISGNLTYTSTDNTYILEFSSEKAYNLTLDVNTCIGLYEIQHKGNIEFQAMACTEIMLRYGICRGPGKPISRNDPLLCFGKQSPFRR